MKSVRPLLIVLASSGCIAGPTFLGDSVDSGEEETTASADTEDPSVSSTATADPTLASASGTTPDGDGNDVTSTGGSTGEAEPPPFEGPLEQALCPEIVKESAYCLSVGTTFSGAVIVGVDSGNECILQPNVPLRSGGPTSMAWIDDTIVYCDQAGVVRVNLVDGSAETGGQPCSAVTSLGGAVLVNGPQFPEQQFTSYLSFEDVLADDPLGTFQVDPWAEVFAENEATLFAAWHSTSFIERFDLATEQQLPDLVLEGYDDWIRGMSIVGSRLFLHDGFILREFDRDSGAAVQGFELEGMREGLACRAGG